MPVRPPQIAELRDIAKTFHLSLGDEALASFRGPLSPDSLGFRLDIDHSASQEAWLGIRSEDLHASA